RRLARKKRSEIDETRGNETPGEEIKKNHLSENNVWTPLDDYRLLLNIMQTKGNLEQVFAGTKFSCFYTSDQIAHRWETLMYDDKAGVLAQNAITNLHPHTKAQIQTEALFSDEEEDLLRTIKYTTSGGNPDLSCFIKLLEDNP
ncbi:Microspherule protein 1, partial [Orchesella cincta]